VAKRLPSTEELIAIAKIAFSEADKEKAPCAILGGLAMQLYGSDRLTKNVDLVSDRLIDPDKPLMKDHPLSFGGTVFKTPHGIDVDWIVRADEYQGLYEAALGSAEEVEGLPVISIEHLAVIKFGAGRPKDYEDLMFLLVHADLEFKKARKLVHKFLGGKFAVDQFDAALDEAKWRASRS
jgi:hypothetical protein